MNVAPGLCHCGCGEKTRISKHTNKKRGTEKEKPMRFINGHNGRLTFGPIFLVDKDGCWIWQGYSSDGRKSEGTFYGKLKRKGRTFWAHRYFYEQVKGPIPEGFHVHHKCRKTLCVNPNHLEAMEPRENYQASRDYVEDGKQAMKDIRRMAGTGDRSESTR